MFAQLRHQVAERDAELVKVREQMKHLRDGLELILCMETAVPNGTTKKIMRTAENALCGKPFDV